MEVRKRELVHRFESIEARGLGSEDELRDYLKAAIAVGGTEFEIVKRSDLYRARQVTAFFEKDGKHFLVVPSALIDASVTEERIREMIKSESP